VSDVVEIAIVLIAVPVVAVLISRFPDTRRWFGDELDDAFYRGSVRALWYAIGISAIALALLWLLV